MNLKLKTLGVIVAGAFAASATPGAHAQQAQGTTDVGRISVEGASTGPGAGFIQQEESPKARSSVSRSAMESMPSSSNPYQAINLLPGVNTFSHDATGLFGGGMRVRGFNSDQMGFTIDGAPVNDSGSFTVFPQEYTDIENLEEIFITQGSTDTDAPHVGASGGNIGIVTANPVDQMRFRAQQSFGDLSYSRTFLRYDTGLLMDNKFKAFISYSKTTVDKWRGSGGADRDHVDAKAIYKIGDGSSLSAGLLYNAAINNNFRTLTLAQIAANGKSFDFSDVAPRHLTGVNGTSQVETASADGYYKFSINPFRNYLATLKGNFKLSDKMRLDVEPYFWYGYGTGGNQLTTLTESNSAAAGAAFNATRLRGGLRDINGDGDTRDTTLVYRSSVTETFRPGATTKLSYQAGDHRIVAGLWYERARHRQTAPSVRIDDAGNAEDIWLQNTGAYLLRQDGTAYQNRDQLTISTGTSYFIQDQFSALGDKLNLTIGARQSKIERDFRNYANEGTGQGADYTVQKSYSSFLPSAGAKYSFTPSQSVFANVAKNFKAPGNFSYGGLLSGGTFVNGVLTGATLNPVLVKAETSVNTDIGYRYQTEKITASAVLFNVDFKDRISRSFDPTNAITTDTNVGNGKLRGAEFEAGWKIATNWNVYGSLSLTDSKNNDNLQVGNGLFESTAGKRFADTPSKLAGLALQYRSGRLAGSVQAKYTGERYSTLVNDQRVGGFTTVDASIAYKFDSGSVVKNPMVRLNVVNLFNRDYLSLNSGSGSLITTRSLAVAGLPAPSSPSYYTGAPRFVSIMLSADFQ